MAYDERAVRGVIAQLLVLLAVGLFALPVRADALPAGPPARRGFQMAFQPGYSLPFGRVSGAPSSDMTDFFNGEVDVVPIVVGWKFTPSLFVGAFGDIGLGGTAGGTALECRAAQATCTSAMVRFGIDVAFSFLPANALNPWIGYGVGVETANFSRSDGSDVGYTGWAYANVSGGIDWRAAPGVGVGPFVDVELGRYDQQDLTDSNGHSTFSDVSHKTVHGWVTIGVRLVIMP
jgi:hypothetical protein